MEPTERASWDDSSYSSLLSTQIGKLSASAASAWFDSDSSEDLSPLQLNY